MPSDRSAMAPLLGLTMDWWVLFYFLFLPTLLGALFTVSCNVAKEFEGICSWL